ncbi:MAG: metal ABC transporter permease [Nitrososphaerota archaeon]|jgi:ABC-type Mn2+/Zn2+ transport system permease subunit|nr:metal ABC transporter permease [Nitrososphaerota archaeon]
MFDLTLFCSLFLALSVGAAAGYLGSLMVLEKMALVGDALSHVALPGLALGITFHFNPYLGAFAFLFITAIIIWQIQRTTKISFEALVGAMFTLALALGILMYGNELEALEEALFGDISQVTLVNAGIAAIVCGIAIVLTKIIYDKLVLVMISEDLAVSKGINVAKTNLLYLFLVSVVVAIGIQIVGTLLVGFLVIVPAIAAKNLSTSMKHYALLSAIFGVIAAVLGVLLWNFMGLNLPFPGPMVVFVGIVIFALSLIINWRLKLTT